MKKKITFYSELSYVFGLIILGFGTAFMERADFGMSMVVAPAYIIHLKVSQYFNWFSFGMAEYALQAVLLVVLVAVRRLFKKGYLFSFVTAVIWGFTLDGCIAITALIPFSGTVMRVVFFVAGMLLCSIGVSLLFRTYISPEVYELVVKEVALWKNKEIHKVKTVYDIVSCLIGIILSFVFFGFGHFEGVKAGTIVCALVNGWLIGRCTKLQDYLFEFKDGLRWRPFFEK